MGVCNHRDLNDNVLRKKFNDSLGSVIDIFPNMKMLKPIKGWDYNDNRLVAKSGDRLSGYGVEWLWQAIDHVVKFWDGNSLNPINVSFGDAQMSGNSNRTFLKSSGFKKKWKHGKDRFHWSKHDKRRKQNDS